MVLRHNRSTKVSANDWAWVMMDWENACTITIRDHGAKAAKRGLHAGPEAASAPMLRCRARRDRDASHHTRPRILSQRNGIGKRRPLLQATLRLVLRWSIVEQASIDFGGDFRRSTKGVRRRHFRQERGSNDLAKRTVIAREQQGERL